ncbi:MAG: hypothetical protein R2834_22160 [Rhodothermales bacterium]
MRYLSSLTALALLLLVAAGCQSDSQDATEMKQVALVDEALPP